MKIDENFYMVVEFTETPFNETSKVVRDLDIYSLLVNENSKMREAFKKVLENYGPYSQITIDGVERSENWIELKAKGKDGELSFYVVLSYDLSDFKSSIYKCIKIFKILSDNGEKRFLVTNVLFMAKERRMLNPTGSKIYLGIDNQDHEEEPFTNEELTCSMKEALKELIEKKD